MAPSRFTLWPPHFGCSRLDSRSASADRERSSRGDAASAQSSRLLIACGPWFVVRNRHSRFSAPHSHLSLAAMGNFIVFQSQLRPEMSGYILPLASVRKIVRRFDSAQSTSGSFGFGINFEAFLSLFKLPASTPPDAEALKLWQCWDTDQNGVTDVLEILSGLLLIAQGRFEEKLDALYSLYDFDENDKITADEMSILTRTSTCGLCKLMGQPEPPGPAIDALSRACFSIVGVGGSSLSREQFLRWVTSTPQILGVVCRFGTKDGEATRKRYAEAAAQDKAAIKIQQAFKNSKAFAAATAGGAGAASTAAASSNSAAASSSQAQSVPRGGSFSTRARNDPAHNSDSMGSGSGFNIHALRRAKAIFDGIDRDGSGAISIRELAASMNASTSAASSSVNNSSGGTAASGGEFASAAMGAFSAMDLDGSGTLTFDEMLKVLYPAARPAEIARMMRAAVGVSVDRESVQALQLFFESRDDDLDGRVLLGPMVAALRKEPAFAALIEGYTVPRGNEQKSVSFLQLLTELFGGSQTGSAGTGSSTAAAQSSATKLSQILAWGSLNPVHQLDEQQQVELETLFRLYDRDGSGSIDMSELRAHFTGLGFSPDEVARLFANYDADASQSVSLVEFKKFYRSVWDSQAKMAVGNSGNGAGATVAGAKGKAGKGSKDESKNMEEQYR